MSAQPLFFPIVTVMFKVVALKDHRFVFLTPTVIILRPWESRKDEDVVLVWALSAFLRYLSPCRSQPWAGLSECARRWVCASLFVHFVCGWLVIDSRGLPALSQGGRYRTEKAPVSDIALVKPGSLLFVCMSVWKSALACALKTISATAVLF